MFIRIFPLIPQEINQKIYNRRGGFKNYSRHALEVVQNNFNKSGIREIPMERHA